MATLVSGFRQGGSPSFSDAMVVGFGHQAVLFNLIKKQGRQGIKFRGSVKAGHEWTCDDVNYAGDPDNARAENACGINPSSEDETIYKNHLQIFSKDTSISGSAKAEEGACARSVDFKDQQTKNRKKLALDIDAALASDREPVARVGETTPGKMAGIKHFVPAANKFDMSDAELNVDIQVTKMLKALNDAGLTGEKFVLIGGSDVYDDITTFYSNKARLAPGDSTGGMKITKIVTGRGDVEVHNYTRFAPNEFMIFAPKYTAFIPFREINGKDITTSSCDGYTEQDLEECTLQACPSALTWAINAGRSKVCSDC